MTKSTVLIVDDEPDIRELLEMTLAKMGIDAVTAENLAQAHQYLEQRSYALCLADMRLPDGDGINLVKHIQKHYPDLPVAVITAYGNVEGAVNTLKAGAFDYVSKPVNLHMLRGLVNAALKLSGSHESENSEYTLLGHSPAMQALRSTISKLARSQAPVYIKGDSGVGKELVARLIHDEGPRAEKPFIPVNCGAIPSELMESEFFGHKKGSFTGANNDKQGLFQAAEGGTLFFDEIADLPMHMQVKLLRAIQEKAIRPIGEQREVPVDVRILSASHKDLSTLVKEEQFRQDLFYRINVIEVQVPSLKDKHEDIPLIVDHILQRLSQEQNVSKPALSAESLAALRDYAFPGNVRELENILERAMTLCEGNDITVADLQLPCHEEVGVKDDIQIEPETMGEVRDEKDAEKTTLNSYLDDTQKEVILSALEKTKWNRTAAAKMLGITLRALRYRLKKLGLD